MESLTPATTAETLAYLARRPYDNVYVGWLIATGQHARGRVALWRDGAGAIGGVCYFNAQIVVCAENATAIDAFAEYARTSRGARMIVGPRGDVERFWERARGLFATPAAIRRSQPVYAIERAALGPIDADPQCAVARATAADLDELVPHAARMIAGEIGGDPTRITEDFRSRCRRIVEAGWWWTYRVDGRLAFTCHVGSQTERTAQVQGVWTPPEFRGHAHATRGLTAICDALLHEFPSLCLYVNDFNVRAVALYERVGFTRVGEFQTILFD